MPAIHVPFKSIQNQGFNLPFVWISHTAQLCRIQSHNVAEIQFDNSGRDAVRRFLLIREFRPSGISYRQRLDCLQLNESEGAYWDRADPIESRLFLHLDICSSLHFRLSSDLAIPLHVASGFKSTSCDHRVYLFGLHTFPFTPVHIQTLGPISSLRHDTHPLRS